MKDSMHHWLPDHQLGVAATLSHADELVGQVADVLFAYQTRPDGTFELEEQLAFPNTRTVVTHVAPMPRKVPLLVADALVALRAALEHALFAEVEFRDGSLNEKAARVVEVPASRRGEDIESWAKGRVKNGPPSLHPGSDLVKRIEGLQPFNRKDVENHPLARLVLHTNHAKHRTPAVTAIRIAAMYQEDQMPRSVRSLPPRPEAPLRVGDVIAETPFGTRVPVALFPTIGINRPGTDRWPVLMHELEEISDWVRTQAVPRLVTGMEPPSPELPTRYEIAVGHVDERRAISAGSTMSAADRHKQRLGAATVRIDMVDMLGQMDGSPSAEQIAAWLDHLTDEEVLERMSRLKPTHTYNPDIVLRNFEGSEGNARRGRGVRSGRGSRRLSGGAGSGLPTPGTLPLSQLFGAGGRAGPASAIRSSPRATRDSRGGGLPACGCPTRRRNRRASAGRCRAWECASCRSSYGCISVQRLPSRMRNSTYQECWKVRWVRAGAPSQTPLRLRAPSRSR